MCRSARFTGDTALIEGEYSSGGRRSRARRIRTWGFGTGLVQPDEGANEAATASAHEQGDSPLIGYDFTPVDAIDRILSSYTRIAVVGLSDDPARPSYGVAVYMGSQRYTILPVNPNIRTWRGLPVYPDLASVPPPVEIVDIFRRPDAVREVVDAAIRIGAKVVWMQEGVIDEDAAARARDAGLEVVMDRCILKEHRHRDAGRR